MGKSTIPADGLRQAFTIYYKDLRAINWFLTESLTDDTVGGKVTATKEIPGHQRRKGPSDQTPVNVTQSTAEYLVDPSLKSGNALPGISFRLQTTADSDIDATRQFTFTGRASDLISYMDGGMKYPTYIYLSNGARHTLAATAPNAG